LFTKNVSNMYIFGITNYIKSLLLRAAISRYAVLLLSSLILAPSFAQVLKKAEIKRPYGELIQKLETQKMAGATPKEEAKWCIDLGMIMLEEGRIEEAYSHFNTANLNLANEQCSGERALSHAYTAYIDHLRGAVLENDTKLGDALFCARELKDYYLESEINLIKGEIDQFEGNYSRAFSSYFKAKEIKEELKDESGLISAHIAIASALTAIGQHSEARTHLQDALTLNKEVGNDHLLADIYNLLTVNYLKQKNLNYANIYAVKGLEASKRVKDNNAIAKSYMAMSELNLAMGDYAKSENYLTKVNDLLAARQYNKLVPEYTWHRASYALASGNMNKAVSLSQNLLQDKKSYISQYDMANAYEIQTAAYTKQSNYKKALEASDAYAKLKEGNGISGAYKQFEQLKTKSEQVVNQTNEIKTKAEEERQYQEERTSKIIRYAMLAGLILMLSLLILLYRQYIVKKGSNKKLEQRNALINKQNQELRKMNTVLEEARQQAEAGSIAKSNFLAVTSHEIRTPMNGIMGMASLMLETPMNEEQTKYVETIQTSSENLLTILNDILDFSKIEAGKMNIESTLIDLEKLLDEVMIIFSKQAKDKNIELSKFIGNAMIKQFRGDVLRIRQVLINLVSNAIKFTGNGYVKIIVEIDELLRAQTEDARIAKLRFSVKDDGIGISEEKQKKIFESFEQEDTSTSRKYGGIGLGLSISKKLVELMGGEIGLTSEKNVGTTFYFTLNVEIPKGLAKQETPTNIIEAEVTELEAATAATGTFAEQYPMRILVAEDNPFNKMFIDKLFEKFGYTNSHHAENGIEVLKKLEHEEIDIILMDIQMPEMDGMQATKRIIEKYGDNRPLIIALTADATESSKDEYLGAGMDGFLSKPFKQEALQQILIDNSKKIKTLV